ncbi:TetR/AcrR family transcriptional regulator [Nocardioides insulae]|uniref:TetR/AcrR family transcriptional regulator n=1 Tax=Nocardioides insulae TaxID=394734 RepID=UPI00041F6826|nr:TetR/AcrR family transcriptional regulator [Nocardioides insulae]
MPRISAATVPEHRHQVHRRIFDAFADLMAQESYDAITMARIAERAGLGRTAIYHHFPDKAAVVVGFASAETEAYVAELEERLASTPDPVLRMRYYIRHQLEAGHTFHMGLGVQLVGRLPDSSRRAIRAHVTAVEDVLRRILAEGVESGTMTVPDPDTALALVHACLTPRDLPSEQVESFVLRALGCP